MRQRLSEHVDAEVLWVVKERKGGLWLPVYEFYNIITNYGLTALAGAPAGGYVAPIYLVIDNASTTMQSTYAPGVTTIVTNGDPTVAGDSQLDLSIGLATQETVTFNSKAGTGPYTWTLAAPTANNHTAGDPVVRTPTVADVLANVLSESQYDPTYAAGKRLSVTASFSPATGQNTMQYFIAGTQATNLFFAHVGLADSLTIGQGNLHNYATLGYNHNSTNDVEIDVTYTLIAV